MLPGPYRIPAYRVAGHYRLTNKTPAATYRSPGRYEGTFVRERVMDAIAEALSLDRVEVRRRNLIAASEMPYARELKALGDEVVLDSGDYAGLLDKALARAQWRDLRRSAESRRRCGEMVGLGLAMFVEKSGLGPKDGVIITVKPSGDVEVVTGGASLGQGFETVIAQICAGTLGCDYRRVQVIRWADEPHRSRHRCARYACDGHDRVGDARGRADCAGPGARPRNAHLMQTDKLSLMIRDGSVMRLNEPKGPSLDLGMIATKLALNPSQSGNGLSAEEVVSHRTYELPLRCSYCAGPDRSADLRRQCREVLDRLRCRPCRKPNDDRRATCRWLCAGTCGALYEEFRYDSRGEPLSVTFADYLIPTVHEVPHVDVLITEDAPSP